MVAEIQIAVIVAAAAAVNYSAAAAVNYSAAGDIAMVMVVVAVLVVAGQN